MRPSKTFVIFATVLSGSSLAQAATINFDTTSNSGWTASGGGAVNAAPYVVANFGNYSGSVLSVTSGGNNSGTFLTGGSLAQFDGFWTATYSFSLPANAANTTFAYSQFFADDRAVMLLNGNIINSTGLPVNGQYTGTMVFSDGGSPQTYLFNGPYGGVAGSVTSGFNIGGLNTIEVIVNNTGTGVVGTMNGNLAPNDGTGIGLSGSISYSVVPEPLGASFILVGALLARIPRKSWNA